jgi:hypothetical protein
MLTSCSIDIDANTEAIASRKNTISVFKNF